MPSVVATASPWPMSTKTPLVRWEPEVLDDVDRAHARRPREGARRDDLASGELGGPLGQALERYVRADLDAAAAQLACGELGEVGRDLGHDPVACLDEDPAHALRSAARVQLDDVGGE